jgi:hypothetical protein
MAFITQSGQSWSITEKVRTAKGWRRQAVVCLGVFSSTQDALLGLPEVIQGLENELAEAREVHQPRIGTPPGHRQVYVIENDVRRWRDRLGTVQKFVAQRGHLARHQRAATQTKQKTKF